MKGYEALLARPVAVSMLFIGTLIFGIVSYTRLPIELLPNTDFNHITVYTPVRGAMPPDWIERQVTIPMEEALSSIPGLSGLESVSKTGEAVVVGRFEVGAEMDMAVLDVREKVHRLMGSLPREVDKPIIAKYRHADLPVMILSLVSETESPEQLREWADTEFKEKLLQLSGVANVEISGGREKRVLIEVSLERLNAFGLPLQQVIQAIQQNNIETAMGNVAEGGRSYFVRGLSRIKKVDELKEIVVRTTKEQALVRVHDVAQVHEEYLEQQTLSRMNSHNVVTLYLQKESSANTLNVCQQIKELLENLNQNQNFQIEIVRDQSESILKAIGSLESSLYLGGALAVLVLYFFLRSWSGLFLVGCCMPLCLAISFLGMYLFHVSLNVMSLSGLAIAVGMFLDSSILTYEKIEQDKENGLLTRSGIALSMKQIAMALVSSTLTTLIVFIPILFVDAELRKTYGGLALTVSFSLLGALVIALILIPVVMAHSRKKESSLKEKRFSNLNERYAKKLESCFKNRSRVFKVILGLFIVSIFLAVKLDKQLDAYEDSGQFLVHVELPAGAKLEESNVAVAEMEAFLRKIPEVQTVTSRLEGWSSKVYVQLLPEKKRNRTTEEIIEQIRPQLQTFGLAQNAFCYFSQSDVSKEISFEVYGHEMEALKEAAYQVGDHLKATPGLQEIKLRYKPGRPEKGLKIDRDRLVQNGWTPREFADLLHAQLRGVEASRFYIEEKEKEILVRLNKEEANRLEEIKKWIVVSPDGTSIALVDLGTWIDVESPSEVWRKNKQRLIEVSAAVHGFFSDKKMKRLYAQLRQLELPKGVSLIPSEDYFKNQKRYRDLLWAFGLAILLIYMLLASFFESLWQPVLVLLTIPLAAIGVFPLLFILGKPVTLGVLLGLILLCGIVVNNAIILISGISEKLKEKQLPLKAALTQVGQERLRPILMTTLTTIIGLVPLAFFSSSEETLWSPLALTVIGGLSASTFLTLFIVPTFYWSVTKEQ